MSTEDFIISEPLATQALTLFTNRLLMDGLSLLIDRGALPREQAEHLIRFSANQVIKGSPQMSDAVTFYAEMSIGRLPASKS